MMSDTCITVIYHTTLYVSDCTVFFYVAYNFN